MEIDRLPCSLKVFGSFSFPHTLFIWHKSIIWIVQLWDHHLSHILIQNSLWKLSISCIKWSYLKFFPGAKHVNYVLLENCLLLIEFRFVLCEWCFFVIIISFSILRIYFHLDTYSVCSPPLGLLAVRLYFCLFCIFLRYAYFASLTHPFFHSLGFNSMSCAFLNDTWI